MRTRRPPAPFTDKALGVFESGNRTDNERRLIATIRQRQSNSDDSDKIKALSGEVERLRKENERLLVDVAKGIQESKQVEPEPPRQPIGPLDPSNCCVDCTARHGPYAQRWFNRVGIYCVCLKCQRTWEQTNEHEKPKQTP